MQFQNCTKTGLTQNFVYSKRHCLRFVLESILRKQRPTVWVKSQLRACVENAGARRSRICDSIPLLAVSHEMTWDPTLDSGSHLIPCELLFCWRMQSLSFVSGFLMPTTSHSHSQLPSTHSQWCFLKTSYLWLSLLCISMEQPGCNEGRLGGGGGLCREATKAFRTPGIFLLISSNTLCLPPQRHLQFSRFKNQNIFPQIAAATAAVLMKVCMRAPDTFLWSDKI